MAARGDDGIRRLRQPRGDDGIPRLRILLFSLILTGCQGHFSQTHGPGADTFVWGLRFYIQTIDPANTNETTTNDVLRQFYETLVDVDGSGHVVPKLADSWTVSPDGKTYRFHIRQGVTFSNRQPLTADDVKFSLERVGNPELSSTLAQSFLAPIAGANERVAGKASSIPGIVVVNPSTLEIHLKEPQPAFLKQLAFPGLSIACRIGTPKDNFVWVTNEMIGTGPFVATSIEGASVLTAYGRTDYWGGPVKLKTLRIETVSDATVALNRFRAGELDLMQIVPADIEAVRSEPKLSACLRLTPKDGVVYLQINSHAFPALADRRVRQALAMSIDRTRLERDVLHDSQKEATRFTAMGSGPVEILPYDPRQAASLMAAAGYPEGKGFPKLQLEYAANGVQNPGAEAIVTDWRTNLGIDATLWAGASGALLAKNQQGNLPLYFTGWTADYSDLGDFLPQIARTGAPENHSGMSVPGLDALLDQISNSADSPRRDELVDLAEKLTMTDAHVIPLYFVTDPELVSPRFSGVEITPFGHMSLAHVAPAPGSARA